MFTPEASPECSPFTEPRATVVTGVKYHPIPKPWTTIAGKKEVQ